MLVPAPALLNPLTILKSERNTVPTHLFPEPLHRSDRKKRRISAVQRLNTTQLLTLHLVLTRDNEQRHQSDWQAYFETLPQSFRPGHPLVWAVDAEAESVNGFWAKIPSEAAAIVRRVKARFDGDLEVIRKVLVRGRSKRVCFALNHLFAETGRAVHLARTRTESVDRRHALGMAYWWAGLSTDSDSY